MNEITKENGYRETELGLLPKEWVIKKLGSLLNVLRNGITMKQNKHGDGLPVTRIETISTGKINLKKVGYVNNISLEKIDKYKLKKGDILFSHINSEPYLGNSAIYYREDYVVLHGMNLLMIRVNKDKLVPYFLNFLFNHYRKKRNFIKLASRAVNQSSINQGKLKQLLIPLPPLEEQKKIAGVLSAVQDAIEKTEAVIQATKDLKKSMMKHLFTYGPVPLSEKENVPLKETEIGMIPEEWEIYKIKELANVKGGKRLPKGHSFSSNRTNFPYIRVSDFKNWGTDMTNIKYLTVKDAKLLRKYTISSEEVYISIAGTIGLVGTIPKKLDNANLTENAAKLIIIDKEKLNRDYLVSFLASNWGQNQIKIRTSKTSQPKLALTRIKTIKIPLPKQITQMQITMILSSIDNKIQAEENKKKALEDLFSSLLHNLMTAKIRVNDLDLEGVEI
ncbi:MAG: hypothetical protein FXF54_09360 [Kosmotoga sp.]|nr:MAG: hypothetical protein FXF54_09360 [Kosmotoga sp.]